jgi:hypothetical protein
MSQRDDGLPGLAQAHVVSEDRARPAEQKGDAFNLVREEPSANWAALRKAASGSPGESASRRANASACASRTLSITAVR